MERYNGVELDPEGAFVYYDDAQRALDAEREKVKGLEALLVGFDGQDEVIEMEKSAYYALRDRLATLQAQADHTRIERNRLWGELADLQAQLADRDAMILQMGKQAARLAKDGIAAKAQLRQVEGERDHAKKMEAVQKEVADNQTWHVQKLKGWRDTVTLALQRPGGARFEDVPGHIKALVKEHDTLRQLVEALPVVDGRMDVECGACYYIRSFIAGQYGVVCGLITEQSTAMAIKALLEYRATQAAQDAGAKLPAWVNEAMRLAPTQTNPPHPTEERS